MRSSLERREDKAKDAQRVPQKAITSLESNQPANDFLNAYVR